MDVARLKILESLSSRTSRSLFMPFQLRLAGATPPRPRSQFARRAKCQCCGLAFRMTWRRSRTRLFRRRHYLTTVIFNLSSVRCLLVIARTSLLPIRNGPFDLQKIGQELGVRYVLSGIVRGRIEQRCDTADSRTYRVVHGSGSIALRSPHGLFDCMSASRTHCMEPSATFARG